MAGSSPKGAKGPPGLSPIGDAAADGGKRRRSPPKLAMQSEAELLSSHASGIAESWTPAPGRPCIVLDFDLTIAQCHVYKELRKRGMFAKPSELGTEFIFGDAERRATLGSFFNRMRAMGAYIAVLTNNSEEVVSECLKLGGLAHAVDQLISVDPCSTKGKDFSLLRPPGVTRWVFADDDLRNIRSVERETRGRVPCILVDGGKGMQPQHLAAVEDGAFGGFAQHLRQATKGNKGSPPHGLDGTGTWGASFGAGQTSGLLPCPRSPSPRPDERSPLSGGTGAGDKDEGLEFLGETIRRALSNCLIPDD
eukprot:TRINITY_DN18718_c0_g1_i1.p1 TRINITY_DN18718_c0_g1~~TRINITY_DN18718_c0_g1_i1.p1  ORF type:complete len:340 (+),score=59.19 TRINITY_DN18718_c0_g1_i1:97-1020(+)